MFWINFTNFSAPESEKQIAQKYRTRKSSAKFLRALNFSALSSGKDFHAAEPNLVKPTNGSKVHRGFPFIDGFLHLVWRRIGRSNQASLVVFFFSSHPEPEPSSTRQTPRSAAICERYLLRASLHIIPSIISISSPSNGCERKFRLLFFTLFCFHQLIRGDSGECDELSGFFFLRSQPQPPPPLRLKAPSARGNRDEIMEEINWLFKV